MYHFPVIDQGQIYIGTFNHPVCNGIYGNLDAIVLNVLLLLQR